MRSRTIKLGAALVAVAALAGGGAAWATGVGGDEQPLTGSALEQATAAALKHTGGGEVIETETGDHGAAYGVEIRLADGQVVEVSLDADFNVVSEADDDDGAGDENEGSDDD
jgi:hypothetical protein